MWCEHNMRSDLLLQNVGAITRIHVLPNTWTCSSSALKDPGLALCRQSEREAGLRCGKLRGWHMESIFHSKSQLQQCEHDAAKQPHYPRYLTSPIPTSCISYTSMVSMLTVRYPSCSMSMGHSPWMKRLIKTSHPRSFDVDSCQTRCSHRLSCG